MHPPDLLGHAQQIESLISDAASGNVAHAYLFTGRKHLGKFTLAKWFAKELLLLDIDKEDRSTVGHQIDRLLHPDLFVIDKLWIEDRQEDFDVIAQYSNIPQQHRAKAKARTDTISIDDVRSLQERLIEVGTGRFRCCLIRSAERMQNEAVNALLKILEEPPEGVVFILTSEALTNLPPTLISRSRVVHFSPVGWQELAPLVEDMSDEDAQFILRLAQGAPGLIMRLKEDPDALRRERQYYATAVSFWHSFSRAERMQFLKPLLERTEEADQFLLHLSLALRQEPLDRRPPHTEALQELLRGFETNVSRPLLLQQFVLAVSRQ